jgi:hypothetical protein
MDGWFTLISFVIGILPTFGLLFAVTSRFERHVNQKDTMTSFIIGLFAGIPLAIVHMFFSFNYEADQVELYLAALLLAPVEALAYQIYINRKKFRGRKDLPFISLGFCLGVSATYIGFLSGWMFRSLDFGYDHVLGLLLFALGVGPLKAAVGLILSRRDVRTVLRPDLAYGTLALVALNVLLFIYLYSIFLWTFAVPIAILGMTLFYFNYGALVRRLKGPR